MQLLFANTHASETPIKWFTRAKLIFLSFETTFSHTFTMVRSLNGFCFLSQVTATQYEDEIRASPEICELTKLTAPPVSSSMGISRGVSLGPIGLDMGLHKGMHHLGGYAATSDKPETSKRGCTRRLELGNSTHLQQPLMKGGESIL